MSFEKGFQTLDNEVQSAELDVTGNIPDWLSGSLVRTGPAKFEVGPEHFNHWFDGLAMLHAFRFDAGRVRYANKYLESDTYETDMDAGRIARGEFGTDPCRSIFKRAMQLFSPGQPTDNANVNVTKLAGQFVAMTETPPRVTFDADSLETTGHFPHRDDIQGDTTTAHPHFDFQRGEAYNFMSSFGRTSSYKVYSQPIDSERRRLVTEVPVETPCYMHSFGMTENYVILTEFPLTIHPLRLLVGAETFAENLTWEPQRGTIFRVIDKETGEVTGTAEGDPFFAFHHINAYENDGELVVDLAAYPDSSLIDSLYLKPLRSGDSPRLAGRLRRCRLAPEGGGVHTETITDQSLELPRINYSEKCAKPYRYVWGNGHRKPGRFIDEIAKIDIEERTSTTWSAEECYPGEPVFVPRPDATAEDDGVLLSVVLDANTERSFLLALDAGDLTEIGRASVPHHIPFGFHGSFFGG